MTYLNEARQQRGFKLEKFCIPRPIWAQRCLADQLSCLEIIARRDGLTRPQIHKTISAHREINPSAVTRALQALQNSGEARLNVCGNGSSWRRDVHERWFITEAGRIRLSDGGGQ